MLSRASIAIASDPNHDPGNLVNQNYFGIDVKDHWEDILRLS